MEAWGLGRWRDSHEKEGFQEVLFTWRSMNVGEQSSILPRRVFMLCFPTLVAFWLMLETGGLLGTVNAG